MVFAYQPSEPQGQLKQGEILSKLWEIEALHPRESVSANPVGLQFNAIEHPRAVVLTPECDLLTDFLARNRTNSEEVAKLLQHIQLCDAYEESEIRSPGRFRGELWKRVRQNQDERYHCIPADEQGGEATRPELYLDFKRMFSIPSQYLYDSLDTGEVGREGIIPSPWLHSLIQRYYSFHSRVGVPDPDDEREGAS